MNESNPDRPAAPAESGDRREPQPWHAADEKAASSPRGDGAPIGTHSLTGGGAKVGQPTAQRRAEVDGEAERSTPRDEPPGAEEPDALAEPRANVGEILGRKP
ncbi:MAG: hypothetical protein AVDCRST_MAG51-2946 [uncultured Ramlibacter sp.]|uniref:Uncharacterized protein n=1 Tax=uncultured Ramlibacter sp. TaxID=260755 RepID=A0A6J4Q8V5_9BURK|nr:MAG: hypothetical protein AVDCRST_MAG51-2946 [uncultured Ramlibacter sp.]